MDNKDFYTVRGYQIHKKNEKSDAQYGNYMNDFTCLQKMDIFDQCSCRRLNVKLHLSPDCRKTEAQSSL